MALVPDPSSKPATTHTRALNASAATPLDPADFDRARRGFIAAIESGVINDSAGRRASDISRYGFLSDDAPDTVHPNLWRHAQLNAHHGLFEVTDGVWQVRGYDISNITFIRGNTGWIVVDP
ncbi:MAG: MBL fold metallo-hydrolase, partial [Actinobacteria bacterium]|nr:MBL fold metallo-hydrolase [Actinomycetota bacterium]